MAKKSAKKKKNRASAPQAKRERDTRTGMDRFAAPASEPPVRPPRKPEKAKKPAKQSGMQVKVGGERLRPQKQEVTKRIAGGSDRKKGSRAQRLRRIVRRKARRAKLTKITAVVLSVACGLFALTAFFQIDEIAFRGLTRYKADTVRATFGVETGENMIFCDSWRGAKRLKESYPYFADVRITRDFPGKLIINVTEAQPAAAVNGTQGGWFILDAEGRILEKTDEQSAKAVAEILGLETAGGAPGTMLTVKEPAALADLTAILGALDDMELLSGVKLYNLENRQRIWLLYEDRFAVCVGTADNLKQKFGLLRELVGDSQFSPSDRGTIDLSQGARAFADMSLTEDEVEQTARGRASIRRIDAPETAAEEAAG